MEQIKPFGFDSSMSINSMSCDDVVVVDVVDVDDVCAVHVKIKIVSLLRMLNCLCHFSNFMPFCAPIFCCRNYRRSSTDLAVFILNFF